MDKHSIGAAAVRHLLRPRAGSCLRFEQKGIGRQELGAGNTATSLSKHGASVHSHNYRASSIGFHNHGEGPSRKPMTHGKYILDAEEKVG